MERSFIRRHVRLSLSDEANSFQTAAALALTEIRGEDKSELAKLLSTIKEGYTEKNEESRRRWGGGIMGAKANAARDKKAKALEAAIKI